MKLTIEQWNGEVIPENCKSIAVDGDIAMKIDGVCFLLQTKGGYNNVVMFRKEPSDVSVKKTIYKFAYIIGRSYGIDYIAVRGVPGKYAFLSRDFAPWTVLDSKPDPDGYECRYVHLTPDLLAKLEMLIG